MRYVPRALLAGGLGLAAAFLAACGASSGLLSANQASSLTGELNTASTDLSHGQCASANAMIGNVETEIANLPASVNPTLVSDLSRGAKTVSALAATDCNGAVSTGSDTSASTTSTATVTHPGTTSTSTSTTTASTPSTPTNTTSSTPTTPSTPATTTPGAGTTSTGSNGGAGLPPGAGGIGNTGVGNTGGNSQGN